MAEAAEAVTSVAEAVTSAAEARALVSSAAADQWARLILAVAVSPLRVISALGIGISPSAVLITAAKSPIALAHAMSG